VTNAFALLRLLPVSDRDKDAEILALRHQVTVLERQLGTTRPRFSPADRAFLTALLHRIPRDVLGRFRLLVRPDTVLRWAARSPGPPSRGQIPPQAPGPTAHRPLHPPAGTAPCTREPLLGLPAHPRRTPRPRHQEAAQPDPDLEPGAPATRPARVRAVLQLPPAASGNRELPATARAARTGPGTSRRHLPSRPQTRPPRRHSPRVPPCR
jgi:hypothetical protein